jgi:hypothetical protein
MIRRPVGRRCSPDSKTQERRRVNLKSERSTTWDPYYVSARLLHKGPRPTWGLMFCTALFLQNKGFWEWAMLGSNQRPLPCERQCDRLLEISRVCKIPANEDILSTTPCPAFQDIYSGCCTVAAQSARFACAQDPGCSLFEQPGGHLFELRFRGFLRSSRP